MILKNSIYHKLWKIVKKLMWNKINNSKNLWIIWIQIYYYYEINLF